MWEMRLSRDLYRVTKQLQRTAARSVLSDLEGSVLSETCGPLLKLHSTGFHYVEDSLRPDSSPVYQSFWEGSPMSRQCEAFSYVPDTTCHTSFCSISVNWAQPLPLTFPNHVWARLSRACWWDRGRRRSMAEQSSHIVRLPPATTLLNYIWTSCLKEILTGKKGNPCGCISVFWNTDIRNMQIGDI